MYGLHARIDKYDDNNDDDFIDDNNDIIDTATMKTLKPVTLTPIAINTILHLHLILAVINGGALHPRRNSRRIRFCHQFDGNQRRRRSPDCRRCSTAATATPHYADDDSYYSFADNSVINFVPVV